MIAENKKRRLLVVGPRKAEASRENGRHSNGPVSEDGKQRSAMNAVRHGLSARSVLLPREDAGEYEEFRRSIVESLDVQGGLELMLAEQVVLAAWRLQRAAQYEKDLVVGIICEEGIRQVRASQEEAEQLLARKAWGPEVTYEEALTATQMIEEDRRESERWAEQQEAEGPAQDAERAQRGLPPLPRKPAEKPEALEYVSLTAEEDPRDRPCNVPRSYAPAVLLRGGELDRLSRFEGMLQRGLYRALYNLQRARAVRLGRAEATAEARSQGGDAACGGLGAGRLS